jgi:tyrosyl-tRNA synthetase
MGGSDQWGNIITGLELIRKKLSRQAFGLTSPLLTTSSGTKMGKSANGAIWLNEDQLSNWDFWQYWRNTEDNDVIKFLKLFTELSISEIIKLETLQGAEINDAKIILANHVTALCRGKEAAEQISITAKNTFNKLQNIEGIPNKNITNPNLSIVDVLNILEFVSSNGEARRLIRGNGAKVNDILINDENFILSNNDYKDGKVKISSGKKKHGHLTLIN